MSRVLRAVIALCLLWACATDKKSFEVYNLVWAISAPAAFLLLVTYGRLNAGTCLSLAVFGLLQLLLFSKMYGKADCYAFCVCSMALAAEGFGFEMYVVHMAAAFTLLAALQLLRGNVNRRGNLKEPVAFLPYITVSLGVILLFFKD
jgi:hypothetical protein